MSLTGRIGRAEDVEVTNGEVAIVGHAWSEITGKEEEDEDSLGFDVMLKMREKAEEKIKRYGRSSGFESMKLDRCLWTYTMVHVELSYSQCG